MYSNLRDFVEALSGAGELKRISTRVSPVLEIAAAADAASKSPAPSLPSASARRTDPRFHALGGPALLFENVEGSDVPVLINAFGSYKRMEMALNCEEGGFEAIGRKLGELVKPEPPRSFGELVGKARELLPLLRTPPKRRRGMGLCQEEIVEGEAVDLTRWPLIRCWPHDGDFAALGYPAGVNDGVPGLGSGSAWDAAYRGRYITLGGIHTVHADDRDDAKPSSHNIGMYRVQLLGKRTMAMHWHMHHDGARHWRSWKALGKPMPVAIALGGESVLPYAATAPLPPGISELLLAGFLHGRGIEMVRGRTVPLWVPANAEIVIEGYVSAEAGGVGFDPRSGEPLGLGAVFEGPFGDHTGFYSLPDRYPVLTVTAITHRRDPIYPTTVVGPPVQEDYFLGKATERVFLPLLKTIVPDIEDYDLPLFGAFHNCAFVKIRKQYPLQARRVMHAVWGAGQMSWTKSVFVVDDDVDVHDTERVLAAAAARCEPSRDIERVRGPLDILDHAAPWLGAGTKFGLDCTRKVEGEQAGSRAALVERAGVDSGAAERLLQACRTVEGVRDAAWHAGGWLLVRVEKPRAGAGRAAGEALARLWRSERSLPAPAFVVLLGDEVDVRNFDSALFHWLAHSDAGRDAWVVPPGDGATGEGGTWMIDATPKLPGDERLSGGECEPVRPWPPYLRVDGELSARARRLLESGPASRRS